MIDASLALYSTAPLVETFSPEAHIRQLLVFEAALARAEANVGIIPTAAAEAIAAACRLDGLDVPGLFAAAAHTGTIVIPLLHALDERLDPATRDVLHWGATSQDAIDTALMLQSREGLHAIEADLQRVCAASAALARRHRTTPMAARTLLQQAVPIPFGLKAALWLALAGRRLHALRRQRDEALLLQFGGAAGTLAVLGDRGMAVAEALAGELGLRLPDLPWHAERDRLATLVSTLGITAGSMAKIAQDVVLLSQTEVAEVRESHGPGAGGSSAMPHKQNPVRTTLALAAARLAVAQVPVALAAMAAEHERSAGGWQSEWAALPQVFLYAGGAAAHVADALEHLRVDAARMRANLSAGGDLVFAESLAAALAPAVGRTVAQGLVRDVTRSAATDGRSLRQAAGEEPRIAAAVTAADLDRIFDPESAWGSAQAFIDRALTVHAGPDADA
jgi:3-carboxy-cis,cis-muconate cycloisomerase